MSQATDQMAEKFAQTLVDLIKSGTAPWQKPWLAASVDPFNPLSGSRYSGVNWMLLQLAAVEKEFHDPRWVTFKQCSEAGGHVKKGEKGTPIVRWIETKLTPEEFTRRMGHAPTPGDFLRFGNADGTLTIAGQRIYTVFNVKQTEGLDLPPLTPPKEQDWDPIQRAEALLQSSGAVIHIGQQGKAFFSPTDDSITLPDRSQFPDPVDFYDTALHELSHWTGAEKRLNRDQSGSFGSMAYAREELVAEISSMMTAMRIGLPHRNAAHASYVEGWLQSLRLNPKEIFNAARSAAKASDYIMAFEQQKLFCLDYEKGRAAWLTPSEFCSAATDCLAVRSASEMTAANARRLIRDGLPPETARLKAVQWYVEPKAYTQDEYHLGLEAFTQPADFLRAAREFSPELAEKAAGVIKTTLGEEAQRSTQAEVDSKPISPESISFWNRARAKRELSKSGKASGKPVPGLLCVDFQKSTAEFLGVEQYTEKCQKILKWSGKSSIFWEEADRLNHEAGTYSGRVWESKFQAAATLLDPISADKAILPNHGVSFNIQPGLALQLAKLQGGALKSEKLFQSLEDLWPKCREHYIISASPAQELTHRDEWKKEIAQYQKFWQQADALQQEKRLEGKDESLDKPIAKLPAAAQEVVKEAASVVVDQALKPAPALAAPAPQRSPDPEGEFIALDLDHKRLFHGFASEIRQHLQLLGRAEHNKSWDDLKSSLAYTNSSRKDYGCLIAPDPSNWKELASLTQQVVVASGASTGKIEPNDVKLLVSHWSYRLGRAPATIAASLKRFRDSGAARSQIDAMRSYFSVRLGVNQAKNAEMER